MILSVWLPNSDESSEIDSEQILLELQAWFTNGPHLLIFFFWKYGLRMTSALLIWGNYKQEWTWE